MFSCRGPNRSTANSGCAAEELKGRSRAPWESIARAPICLQQLQRIHIDEKGGFGNLFRVGIGVGCREQLG